MTDRSPRQRMIESAALLICQRGVEATSFADVLEHSGAPRGSIYHHFPGGKAQLVEEATRWSGEAFAAGARAAFDGDDPVRGLEAIYEAWRGVLAESRFAAGCPVVAVTVDAGASAGARDAAAGAFRSWQDAYIDALVRSGVERRRARSLAALAVSAIEGAIILSRAQQSLAPLQKVRDELRTSFAAALPDG